MPRILLALILLISQISMSQDILLTYDKYDNSGVLIDSVIVEKYISEELIILKYNDDKRPFIIQYFVKNDSLFNYFPNSGVKFSHSNYISDKQFNDNQAKRNFKYENDSTLTHMGLKCYLAYETIEKEDMTYYYESWYTKDIPFKVVNFIEDNTELKGLAVILKTNDFIIKLSKIDTVPKYNISTESYITIREYYKQRNLPFMDFAKILNALDGRKLENIDGIELDSILRKYSEPIKIIM